MESIPDDVIAFHIVTNLDTVEDVFNFLRTCKRYWSLWKEPHVQKHILSLMMQYYGLDLFLPPFKLKNLRNNYRKIQYQTVVDKIRRDYDLSFNVWNWRKFIVTYPSYRDIRKLVWKNMETCPTVDRNQMVRHRLAREDHKCIHCCTHDRQYLEHHMFLNKDHYISCYQFRKRRDRWSMETVTEKKNHVIHGMNGVYDINLNLFVDGVLHGDIEFTMFDDIYCLLMGKKYLPYRNLDNEIGVGIFVMG